MELNEHLRDLHDQGRVAVLSFCEGLPTSLPLLTSYLPKIVIVPFESGYPGFGLVHMLHDKDHIGACKPSSREDTAYSLTHDFISRIAQDTQGWLGSHAGPGASAN